jgi:hypothetical protein
MDFEPTKLILYRKKLRSPYLLKYYTLNLCPRLTRSMPPLSMPANNHTVSKY